MAIMTFLFVLGFLPGPRDPVAVLADPDTAWADTVRVAAEKAWVAGIATASDPLVCAFSSRGFLINGIPMFVKPPLPGQEGIDALELAAARAFRAGGADTARRVFAASALVDTVVVSENGDFRITRADGLSYDTGADNILHNHGELVGEEDLAKAERTRAALETVARWSRPPAALIITSSGSVIPLTGDAGAAERQVNFLLSGSDPDSLPPGPIWRDSRDLIRDFEAVGRRSRSR